MCHVLMCMPHQGGNDCEVSVGYLHPSVVIIDHSGHLGLLQHDL